MIVGDVVDNRETNTCNVFVCLFDYNIVSYVCLQSMTVGFIKNYTSEGGLVSNTAPRKSAEVQITGWFFLFL